MVSPSNFVHEIVPPFYFLHDAGAFVEAGSYNVRSLKIKALRAAFMTHIASIATNCFL